MNVFKSPHSPEYCAKTIYAANDSREGEDRVKTILNAKTVSNAKIRTFNLESMKLYNWYFIDTYTFCSDLHILFLSKQWKH